MEKVSTEPKSEVVQRIMDAARDVFARDGFAGARVDDIAAHAGVNKASLYYHIGDKQALYACILHEAIGKAVDRLIQAIKPEQSPEEKIKSYIRTLAAHIDANPHMPQIMMREFASGGQNLPEIFFEDIFHILSTVIGIIDEGIRQGVFIATLAPLVHIMLMGPLLIYKTSGPILMRHPLIKAYFMDKGLDTTGYMVSGSVADEIEKLILRSLKS